MISEVIEAVQGVFEASVLLPSSHLWLRAGVVRGGKGLEHMGTGSCPPLAPRAAVPPDEPVGVGAAGSRDISLENMPVGTKDNPNVQRLVSPSLQL